MNITTDSAAQHVRGLIDRGEHIAPGTAIRCMLTDDADAVHTIVAVGGRLLDLASGIPVEETEIVTETIHQVERLGEPARTADHASPVAAGHVAVRAVLVRAAADALASFEVEPLAGLLDALASRRLDAAATLPSAAERLRSVADELHPAKPQPWAPWESRDAELSRRIREIAEDV